MTEIVALITARGGSKGLPRKNILPLAGKPVIAWSIDAARRAPSVSRVIVSTDDVEIARISVEWGAEVPFLRPADLARDDTPHIDVVEHALHWLKETTGHFPEYLLLLQPTSPLRTVEDIETAVTVANTHHAHAVVSVSEAEKHPNLMMTLQADGTMTRFFPCDVTDLRRQTLPPVYVLNGAIYLNRSTSLLETRSFFPDGTHAYIMPAARALDIDTPRDLLVTQLILDHYDAYLGL